MDHEGQRQKVEHGATAAVSARMKQRSTSVAFGERCRPSLRFLAHRRSGKSYSTRTKLAHKAPQSGRRGPALGEEENTAFACSPRSATPSQAMSDVVEPPAAHPGAKDPAHLPPSASLPSPPLTPTRHLERTDSPRPVSQSRLPVQQQSKKEKWDGRIKEASCAWTCSL